MAHSGRRRRDRLTRTILLGAAALVAFCWVLVRWWDIPLSVLLGYIGLSLGMVAVAAVLGVGGAAVLRLLRRLRGG